jgi:hypothetical protein
MRGRNDRDIRSITRVIKRPRRSAAGGRAGPIVSETCLHSAASTSPQTTSVPQCAEGTTKMDDRIHVISGMKARNSLGDKGMSCQSDGLSVCVAVGRVLEAERRGAFQPRKRVVSAVSSCLLTARTAGPAASPRAAATHPEAVT